MILFTLLLGGLLAFPSNANPNPACPLHHGAQGVSVRLPPSLNAIYPQPTWNAPPIGWYFKLWSMAYASNLQYAAFRNFQYDPTPIDPANPAGQVNDLTSFQLPGNNTIYTSYGIDTPHPRFSAVLEYAGTGILEGATSEYSVLAWGCDIKGIPYYASYSTAAKLTNTPAGIDMMSTSDKGPDDATVDAIVQALKNLCNQEILDLAGSLTKMTQDGARDGLPSVFCDDYCKTNQNLIDILG